MSKNMLYTSHMSSHGHGRGFESRPTSYFVGFLLTTYYLLLITDYLLLPSYLHLTLTAVFEEIVQPSNIKLEPPCPFKQTPPPLPPPVLETIWQWLNSTWQSDWGRPLAVLYLPQIKTALNPQLDIIRQLRKATMAAKSMRAPLF